MKTLILLATHGFHWVISYIENSQVSEANQQGIKILQKAVKKVLSYFVFWG